MYGPVDRSPVNGASGPEGAEATRWDRWIFALLLGLQIALIWSFPQIPTTDGPAHRYSAWAYLELSQADDSVLSRFFEKRAGWLYPNAAYSYFLIQTGSWLPLALAEKVGVSLYLIALAVSFRFFFKSYGGRGWLAQILLLTVSLGYLFFMGFLNFLWGVPLVLAALACHRRLIHRPSPTALVMANLFLALAFWSHLMAFAVGVSCMLAHTLLERGRRIVWLTLGWLPATVGAWTSWPESVGALTEWQYRDTLGERIRRILSFELAASFERVETAVAAGVGLVIVALAVYSAWKRRSQPASRALLALCLLLLLVGLAVPRGAGAGFYLDNRVALFFWLFLIGMIESPSGRARWAPIALAACLITIHTAYLTTVFRKYNRQYSILVSGAKHIPSGAMYFCYASHRPETPDLVEPFSHINSLFGLELRSPNFFLYQAIPRHAGHFPVRYTEEGLSRYPGERLGIEVPVSSVSTFAEYVVLWGGNRRVRDRLQQDYGYRPTYRKRRLRIFEAADTVLETELENLRLTADPIRRARLATRIVERRNLDVETVGSDEVLVSNVYADRWTRGTRPAALVIENRGEIALIPSLRVHGNAKHGDQPFAVLVEDGEQTSSYELTRRRPKRIELSAVAPKSARLYIVWADRGWSPTFLSLRRLGVRVAEVDLHAKAL